MLVVALLLPLRAPAPGAGRLPRRLRGGRGALGGVGREAERRAEVRQLRLVREWGRIKHTVPPPIHIRLGALHPTLTWPCCEMSTF